MNDINEPKSGSVYASTLCGLQNFTAVKQACQSAAVAKVEAEAQEVFRVITRRFFERLYFVAYEQVRCRVLVVVCRAVVLLYSLRFTLACGKERLRAFVVLEYHRWRLLGLHDETVCLECFITKVGDYPS